MSRIRLRPPRMSAYRPPKRSSGAVSAPIMGVPTSTLALVQVAELPPI
ncbi:hypothetical protein PJP10_18680 [Mycobacterium kansasii]